MNHFYLRSFLFFILSFSTSLYAGHHQYFIGNPPVPPGTTDNLGTPYTNTVTLNSVDGDDLIIDNGGRLEPNVAGDPAVLINVTNVGEQAVDITNQGRIFSNNTPVNAMIETSAGDLGGGGTITIINDGLRRTTAPIDAIGGTLDGNVIGTNITTFSNTTFNSPVFLINQRDADITNGTVRLSPAFGSTAQITLQLGNNVAGYNGGSLTNVDVIGDAAGGGGSGLDVVDVQGQFDLTAGNSIQDVSVIKNNTLAGNAFTVNAVIAGFFSFQTFQNSITNINVNVDGNPAAFNQYNNQGTTTLTNSRIFTSSLVNSASGIFNMQGGSSVLVPAGAFSNAGIFNSNDNNGFLNAFQVLSFVNTGTLNVNNTIARPLSLNFVTNFNNTNIVNVNGSLLKTNANLNNNGTFNLNNGGDINVGGFDFINNTVFNLFQGGTFTGNSLNNNGTMNIGANSTFTSPITSAVGGSIVNVNGTFTTGNTITDVTNINVNAGTFTIDQLISGFTNFNTLAGTTTQLNTTLTFGAASNLNNLGTFNINNVGVVEGIAGMTFTNAGIFNVNNGGRFGSPGTENFSNTGLTTAFNGGTFNAGVLTNSGTFNLNTGSTFSIGTLNNSGIFNLGTTFAFNGSNINNSGTFNVNSNGSVTSTSSMPFVNNGILNVNNGGNVNLLALTNNNIVNANTGSTLSIGTFNNANTFNLRPGSVLNANSFINNGTVSLYGGTLNAPLTSSINNPVLNVVGNFTSSQNISNHPTINVGNSGTTFRIQSVVTGLSNLNMATNTTTILAPGGSITTSQLSLTNAGTLVLAGGSFSGDLFGTPASTVNVASDYSTTGSISNVGTILASNGNFTINTPITGYNLFKNSATVIMNGGTISGGMQGNGPGSNLIINKDFSTNGILGEGIFLDNITINPGATLYLRHQANVSGNTFVNNGNLALTTTQTINGAYLQTGSGSFTTTLLNNTVGNYGQINVVGPATVGGQINLLVLDNGSQINNQDTFDIITATSLTNNNPVLNTPNTFNLNFARDPSAPSNIYRIVANRSPFVSFANDNPSLMGLGQALDIINQTSNDPEMRYMLSQLIAQPNRDALIAAMTSLLPNDINGAHITSSLITQDILLEKITNRLDEQRRAVKRILKMEGYIAGDLRDIFEPGVYGFTNHIKQSRRNNIDGYGAHTSGIGILADVPIDCWTRIGFAINYANTAVKADTTGNRSYINNYQGTIYGSYEYGYAFIDGLLSLASNEYKLHRNIGFLNQSASAKYYGHQSNGKIRAGLDFIFDIFQLMPLASIEYTHLNQHRYTEKGIAPRLHVNKRHTRALETGYGIQLALCKSDIFIPEIHVMGLHFIKNPNIAITSRFTNAGPAFLAIGPRLPKNGVNYGGGFTAWISEYLTLAGRYDLEVRGRHNLRSHSLSIKCKYLF